MRHMGLAQLLLTIAVAGDVIAQPSRPTIPFLRRRRLEAEGDLGPQPARPSQPFIRRTRQLNQEGDVCSTNDGKLFGLLPQEPGVDAVPLLVKAAASTSTSMIFVDRWKKGTQRSDKTLYIKSDVTLTKPLVLGTYVTIDVAAGVTLTLAAQPLLPKRGVFVGKGKVKLVPSNGVSQYWVMPEWWKGALSSDSDLLDAATAACGTASCRVVLSTRYTLNRAWRLRPNTQPWPSPNAEFHGIPGRNGQGVIFVSGTYNPRTHFALPRIFSFSEFGVKLEDVSGLDLYVHNMKYNGRGILLAPSKAIRNINVEVPVITHGTTIFSVEARAAGTVLENVYLRSYIYLQAMPVGSVLTHFKGPPPTLINTRIENSEIVGGKDTSRMVFTLLRNDGPGAVNGLTYRAPTWIGALPPKLVVAAGEFNGLSAGVRVTKELEGTVSLKGRNNTLEWWALSRLVATPKEREAYTMLTAPAPGTAPLSRNSFTLILPKLTKSWPAGARRTFYIYHVLMTGDTDSNTMSLGPHNQAKMPPVARFANPGIVVAKLEDQGSSVKNQLAITLKNVGKRALDNSNFQFNGKDWSVPLQFRLHVGVRPFR